MGSVKLGTIDVTFATQSPTYPVDMYIASDDAGRAGHPSEASGGMERSVGGFSVKTAGGRANAITVTGPSLSTARDGRVADVMSMTARNPAITTRAICRRAENVERRRFIQPIPDHKGEETGGCLSSREAPGL